MATIRKRGDTWRAEVRRQGINRSASFPTKARAQAWATRTEADILDGKTGNIPNKLLSDLLRRYGNEVSIHKRSKRWEQNRIDYLIKDTFTNVPLPELAPEHFAGWRDRRLREVSAATILRDWNLLSAAINVAINEWGWLKENPLKPVARPKTPLPRTRRITQDEIDRLLYALGYSYDQSPETVTARVGAAMLFAIETAMRIGEICSIQKNHIHPRHIHIPKTKNGFPRDVPLSTEARRILEQLPTETGGPVFGITTSQTDALFRKAKARALIDDLHFHDTRREALTRLAKKLDVMALAKVSGHRDLRILQSVYYAPTIDYLADKLD